MLEASDTPALDTSAHTPPGDDSVQVLRDLIERMQAEIKFVRARNEALNFEIARLKRWRFGSSAESLDGSTQAVLFDAILGDTELEDQAARDAAAKAAAAAPAAPKTKRKSVRQPLPANLPRIDRHHALGATHCDCGVALTRIGEEVSEQLDCVPAKFFVLRNIRGKYACLCCQTIQAAPMPAQMIDKGIPEGHEGAPRGSPGCWRKWPSPRSTTTCRCTARPRFMPVQACTSRARAWRSGWASAGCAWRRWVQRSRNSSSATA